MKPRRLLHVESLCVRMNLNPSLTKLTRCIMIYIYRSVGSHCRRVSRAITFVVGARFVHLAFVLAHQAAYKIYLSPKLVLRLTLVQSQGGELLHLYFSGRYVVFARVLAIVVPGRTFRSRLSAEGRQPGQKAQPTSNVMAFDTITTAK